MATHSRILAWEIPGQRNLVGYNPWGHEALEGLSACAHRPHTHTHTQPPLMGGL